MPADFPDDPLAGRADKLFRELELDTEQQLDPLPASEIRRLGDRRRSRRRAGYTAGALATVAVAATSVMTLTPRHDHLDAAPAASPSATASSRPTIATSTASSTPVASVTPSTSALPTSVPSDDGSTPPASQTASPSQAPSTAGDPSNAGTPSAGASLPASPSPSPEPSTPSASASASQGAAAWSNVPDGQVVYDRSPGDLSQYERAEGARVSSSNLSWCTGSFSSLGASSMFSRNFNGSRFNAAVIVFDFPTADQASAGRGTIRQWFSQCPARLTGLGYQDVALTPAEEITPQGSPTPAQISYRTVSGTDLSNQAGYQQDLLVQAGRRIAWIQYVATGEPATGKAPSTSPAEMPGTARAQEILAVLGS